MEIGNTWPTDSSARSTHPIDSREELDFPLEARKYFRLFSVPMTTRLEKTTQLIVAWAEYAKYLQVAEAPPGNGPLRLFFDGIKERWLADPKEREAAAVAQPGAPARRSLRTVQPMPAEGPGGS